MARQPVRTHPGFVMRRPLKQIPATVLEDLQHQDAGQVRVKLASATDHAGLVRQLVQEQ